MLSTAQDGAVALLTLKRPERRNALGTELVEALAASLHRCEQDATVRAVLLRGVTPGFCAGSDVKELAGLELDGKLEHEARTARLARSIAGLGKPVVVAVSGFALGGGMFLAASCDLVVTAADARWHLPEVRLGWIPPWGFAALIGRVGLARARLLTLESEAMSGIEALRLGLADRLAADAAAADALALEEARRLAGLPTDGVAATKRFFAERLAEEAERLDQRAGELFAENCLRSAAQQSFAQRSGR